MIRAAPARGLIALLRLPYWLMTGGLSVLTSFAITKNMIAPQTILLIFFSMAFITSAGFAINDYFDRESDAVIKPAAKSKPEIATTCFSERAPDGMGRFGLITASLSLSK